MNDYIGLCRLGAWLDSFPASYDLVPLPPICLTVVSPRFTDQGVHSIYTSSFWDLSHKMRSALFFLSFDSQSYARTTHPPLPVVPENTHSSSPSYMLYATGRSILFTAREPSPWPPSATTATLFLSAWG